MSDPRFPIGPFTARDNPTPQDVAGWIDEIERTPARLKQAVAGLSDAQLDTPYREGGWTVRQVAHHLPDSHLNSYVRFRLALTEDHPTIRPYDEAAWAELSDYRLPVEDAVSLLREVHRRWVFLLRGLTTEDLARTFVHPDLGTVRLDTNVHIYAWHGRHHVAHITTLRTQRGW